MLQELMQTPFFVRAVIALLLAGVACSATGVWVLVMKFSFVGMCISHAAFAGALVALFFDLPIVAMSIVFSMGCAALLGPLSDRGQLSPDAATGILFSGTLGVAFLMMGMMPANANAAMNLLWGSVLTITSDDLLALAVVTVLLIVVLVVFFKETQSVIFSRELANASGVAASLFFYLMLFLAGMTAAASLKTVGGLLVFSLMINPAAAAYQLTYSLKKMYVLAALFGVLAGWGGLAVATALDLPVGASVILFSCAIFCVCAIFSPKRHAKPKRILQ